MKKRFQKCRQQIEFCFSDEPVASGLSDSAQMTVMSQWRLSARACIPRSTDGPHFSVDFEYFVTTAAFVYTQAEQGVHVPA